MKIVYDFRIFSRQRHGGISRYFFELAKRIDALNGADARILAPLYVNHYLKAEGAARKAGFYLKKSPAFTQAITENINILLSRGSLVLSKPDILHETYYGEKGLAGSGVKTVTTIYDMIHEKFPQLYPGDETPHLKAAAVKRAGHIFCISRKTQDDLIEILGVERARTSVTHLGCDFHLREKDVQRRPLAFPYLLFVGPRGKHKNFKVLASAFAGSQRLMRDFKLVCFGSTGFQPDELEHFLKLGIPGDKILHVTGEDDLLPTFYAHAVAFIYPSLYEGFGFPPLEAMALGCPTVCSDAGSIPEILGNATEYFSSDQPEALRLSLEKVAFLSADKRREITEKGRKRAAGYTWEKCAEETYGTYKALLSR